jgi:hypothetical protein
VAAVAVLLAALGVFGTGTGWPDLIVAVVLTHSQAELRQSTREGAVGAG